MFTFMIDSTHIFLVIYTVFCLVFIHNMYRIRYEKKYKEFSDEMHRQYLYLLKNATETANREALINIMNIDKKEDLNEKCPYCKHRYEKDLPTL